ncbi:N-glycosylase/DNA lyase [Pseudolycoriella hygida]|uniref:N-glycosylase/DNA lyase n=1 Tax=Pseudolycoriella hygida TaxID=35572 RepID=A0A9Q0MKL6_9DIPT|nr:N-glycosylase/DNA lyase [Pseudolycoriella hygida]
MTSKWINLSCSPIQLSTTLTGGQSFRWKRFSNDNTTDSTSCFIGIMANCLWLLQETDKSVQFQVLGELPYPKDSEFSIVRMKVPEPEMNSTKENNALLYPEEYYKSLLRSYFRLDVDLEKYYAQWSAAHRHFKEEATRFSAIRMLNQEPVENLFSFICSQNNHISRISSLVEKLCSQYGPKICDFQGVSYYAFPDAAKLSAPKVEGELRSAAFGYRAKFIQKSAAEVLAKGNLEWFHKLQKLDYKEAHAELTQLTGIGPKVADCICLMSLNHLQAIPVDTHVYQIAKLHYLPKLKDVKNVTPKVYNEIGDKFREVYGSSAGWAQTVLFCSDLAKFKEESSNDVVARKRSKKC